MRPSLRFLGLAVFGWAGSRRSARRSCPAPISSGSSRAKRRRAAADRRRPNSRRSSRSPTAPPSLRLEPILHMPPCRAAPCAMSQRCVGVPGLRCARRGPRLPAAGGALRRASRLTYRRLRPRFYAAIPPLDDWPLPRSHRRRCRRCVSVVRAAGPAQPPAPLAPIRQARPAAADQLGVAPQPADRHRRIAFAGERRPARRKPGRRAPGLQFRPPDLALSARARAREVGRRGGEVAAGVRIQPLRQHPGLAHRRTAPGDRRVSAAAAAPLPCSSKAASTSARCRGDSASTPISGRGRRPQEPRPVRRWRARRDAPGVPQFLRRVRRLGRRAAGPLSRSSRPAADHARAQQRASVHVDWRQRLAGNARPGSARRSPWPADF